MTAPKPPAQKKRGPPPRVTGKLARAIDALLYGEARTQAEAAAIAGMTREHLSRSLKREHVAEYVRSQTARLDKTVLLARANAVVVDLLANSESDAVRADLAKHVRSANGMGAVSPAGGGAQMGGGIVLNIVVGGPAEGQQSPSIRAKSVQAQPIDGEIIDGSDG